MEDHSKVLNINVGVLGHVDSGKTSLVKALSTSLSTAALDKSSQSQQRGITLDLGFSAFSMTIPPHLEEEAGDKYDKLQFTLVDCPGHSSLIRTIIGGAQIIDMIILVVDINKGIQTQTAECIVIGEITTEKMIIVLNKVDMLPLEDREERIERMKKKLRTVFSSTKFSDPAFVLTSAAVGGEKAAAVPTSLGKESTNNTGKSKSSKGTTVQIESTGVDNLVEVVRSSIQMPRRSFDGPFYFAIDHCFPIKGHGTVLTGTVLNGTVQTNSTIELPLLQLQRKVKSMQMFRKPVKLARQGDRVGICVASLDAKLVERGIATTPNSVPLLSTVVCLVRKVRFFRFPCKSNSKFHITIGHTTINATVTFFGIKEIKEQMIKNEEKTEVSCETSKASLSSCYSSKFPPLDFSWDADFEYQEELVGAPVGDLVYGNEPVQWALLQFQQPVYCPMGSLIIGSRLETLDATDRAGGGGQHCRLSFYGPIISHMPQPKLNITAGKGIKPHPLQPLRLYRWKEKECTVHRVVDVRGDLCFEAIGHNLYSKSAANSITAYLGMILANEEGQLIGYIHKAFGSTNKFRIRFPNGAANIEAGTTLFLKFKRYVHDCRKLMQQTGMALEEASESETKLYHDTFPHNSSSDSAEDSDDDAHVRDNSENHPERPPEDQLASPAKSLPRSVGISLPSQSSNKTVSISKTTEPKSKESKDVDSKEAVHQKGLPKNDFKRGNKEDCEPSKTILTKPKKPSDTAPLDLSSIGQKRITPKARPDPSESGPKMKPGQQQHFMSHLLATSPYSRPDHAREAPPPAAVTTKQHDSAGHSFDRDAPKKHYPQLEQPKSKHAGVSPVSILKYDYSTPSEHHAQSQKQQRHVLQGDTALVNTKSNNDIARIGKIESIKQTPEGEYVAIVVGAFRMEENIRAFSGSSASGEAGQEGVLLGPFAKMGKCKVKFFHSDKSPSALPKAKSSVTITLNPI